MLSSGSQQLNCPGISNAQLFPPKHSHIFRQHISFMMGLPWHSLLPGASCFKKPHLKPLPLFLWRVLHGTLPFLTPRPFHFQSHGIFSTCICVSAHVPSLRKLWQCLYPTVPSVLILMALHCSILKCFYTGNICQLCLTHPFHSLHPDVLFSSL